MGSVAERKRIALRHKTGSVGSLLGCCTPPCVRDHKRDNVRAIRELERQLRHRRAQLELAAGHAAFKLRQFQGVPSRLHQAPQRPGTCELFPAGLHGSPWPGGETPPRRPRSAGAIVFGPGARSPWARAEPVALERALERCRRRGPETSPCYDGTSGLDSPPPSWWPAAAEPATAKSVEPDLPPGYRLMPDEERLQALEDLKLKLAELDQRYSRLPLKIETEGRRNQQRALREKIAETESAVQLFSRAKVLVEI